MQIHGTCVALTGAGVLLLGPSGAGKSDLALRLLDRGFTLVADDRVDVVDGTASAPIALAGMLEVRGLGLLQFPCEPTARLVLVIELGTADRLPLPARYAPLDLPLVVLNPAGASAAQRVELALQCALGIRAQRAGAFAA